MSEYIALGDTVNFGITISNPSGSIGNLINADTTPRWYVFTSTSGDNPLMQGAFTARAGIVGTYKSSFVASSANNFVTGDFCEVQASGQVNGVQGRAIIKTFVIDDLYRVNVIQVSGQPVEIAEDTYFASIKFIKDISVPNDEYVVQWYKNAYALPSGQVTNAYVSVYNTSNNTALITNQRMHYQSVSHGGLRYNEVASLATSGEIYLAIASGTIGGSVRTWTNPIGIDYL